MEEGFEVGHVVEDARTYLGIARAFVLTAHTSSVLGRTPRYSAASAVFNFFWGSDIFSPLVFCRRRGESAGLERRIASRQRNKIRRSEERLKKNLRALKNSEIFEQIFFDFSRLYYL